jgi:capsid protein
MSAAAAFGVPYHRMTGDVTNANYTSLRADVVPYYARLDEVTANEIVTHMCDPAFRRRMRIEAIKARDPRLNEVTTEWTPAARPWVNPLDDIQAEKMEIRAFPGEFKRACSRRGIDWRKAIADQAEVNALLDSSRVAMDTDPRRIDGAGKIQSPVGYLGSGEAAVLGAPAVDPAVGANKPN